MVSADDTEEAEDIVANDPGVRKILKERYGITDMSMVAADPWYYGDRYGELMHHYIPSPACKHAVQACLQGDAV